MASINRKRELVGPRWPFSASKQPYRTAMRACLRSLGVFGAFLVGLGSGSALRAGIFGWICGAHKNPRGCFKPIPGGGVTKSPLLSQLPLNHGQPPQQPRPQQPPRRRSWPLHNTQSPRPAPRCYSRGPTYHGTPGCTNLSCSRCIRRTSA